VDLNIVLRLEKKIDQLLARNQALVEERNRLLAEKKTLADERERFCVELDGVLAKLDRLDQEMP
jgi:hypothetical protein